MRTHGMKRFDSASPNVQTMVEIRQNNIKYVYPRIGWEEILQKSSRFACKMQKTTFSMFFFSIKYPVNQSIDR